jgi:poly(3-hydroxybutyrate) depolymerase
MQPPKILRVASLLVLPALGFGACKPQPAAEKNVLSHAAESWCPEGFEPGPNDTCFALPAEPTKDTPVLVYLHGLYVGHGSPAEWEAVRLAAQRGFAVVVPRGKRGLCDWRAELKDHFCWPQDPEDTEAIRGLIKEWERVLWQVDALLEGGPHKRYVLGSSNGGFFAAFVATHGLFDGRAYAIVNGGVLAPPGKSKPAPMILIGTSESEEGGKLRELHETLGKASWAHAFCPRPGAATITPDDVELALRFFKRDAEGTLKAQNWTYPCDGSTPPNPRAKRERSPLETH